VKVLSRRSFASGVAALAFVRAAQAQPAVTPLAVRATAIALSGDDPGLTRVGNLEWRGGFALESEQPRFGGFSDLLISEDGRALTMISDRGSWAECALVRNAAGVLTQVSGRRSGPLIDLNLAPLRSPFDDAEGLARLADGSLVVSFEQRHRIWVYPPGDPPFLRRPRAIAPPPGVEAAPRNGGMETLASLPDGRLVTIAEDLILDGAHAAWIHDGRNWARASYRTEDGFKPTGACALPGGDLLVLEREFGFLRGWRVRIVRVAARLIQPGAPITGIELARFDHRHAIDNFEGIAVVQARGETLVHLISDDNFSRWQRTLLVCFALR
jgi:hypothetical protein